MERLFDERLFRPTWLGNGEREAAPALDLYTTPEAIVAKVVLPGVKPQKAWSDKRERQYEHIKDSYEDRGVSTDETEERAARTVNKERAEHGETKRQKRGRS